MHDAATLGGFLVWYLVFLIALTIHEAAHALGAYRGGDSTAYRGGQVTLNPWPHMRREPFGTVIFPLLSYFTRGWMMGWASAPYDPAWGRAYPLKLAAMSAAGPAANLLLAFLAFLALKALLAAGVFVAPPLRAGFDHLVEPALAHSGSSWAEALGMGLSVALNLNFMLCLFNLIPLPPLDGSSIVAGIFPGSARRFVEYLSRNPIASIIGLVIVWRFFSYRPALKLVLALLHPGHVYRFGEG